MNTNQAVKYINHVLESDYTEGELELVHIATVQVIGSRIETILKRGKLFDAMDAFMLTPEGKTLEISVRNAPVGNVSFAAAELGRKGGSATSEIKKKSSRENGKLGGRPKTKRD